MGFNREYPNPVGASDKDLNETDVIVQALREAVRLDYEWMDLQQHKAETAERETLLNQQRDECWGVYKKRLEEHQLRASGSLQAIPAATSR